LNHLAHAAPSHSQTVTKLGATVKVALTASLELHRTPVGEHVLPGVFLGRPGVLILSDGERVTTLRFEGAEDVANLAIGLACLAESIGADATAAAVAADACLARLLAGCETAGNA